MNLPLMRLSARRAAPLPALVAVAGVVLLAILGQPGRGEIIEISPRFEEVVLGADEIATSTAWIAGLLFASTLAVVFAARIPDRWFREEGDWLGVTGTSRSSIVRTTLAGLAAGSAMFAASMGLVSATLGTSQGGPSPGGEAQGELLELALVAGPERSFVLMPGERFEQTLPDSAFGVGARVRIRVTPALGAGGPTTNARIDLPDRSAESMVARRSWMEIAAPRGPGPVTVTNTGTGALAILGPDPVEAWRPSSAAASGQLRLAGHVALHLLCLAALAFGLGAWMGPGIAAALTVALWLGARMALPTLGLEDALPGGRSLEAALTAIAEGRSPRNVTPTLVGAATGATLVGFVLARAALGSWRREARSS